MYCVRIRRCVTSRVTRYDATMVLSLSTNLVKQSRFLHRLVCNDCVEFDSSTSSLFKSFVVVWEFLVQLNHKRLV